MADSALSSMEDVLSYLLSYRVNDFYARLMANLPIMTMVKENFSMGVTFKDGHHILLYNPEWLEKKLHEGMGGLNETRAVLAHEAMHVVLAHVARHVRLYGSYNYSEVETRRYNRVSNLAADVVVNDLLIEETGQNGSAYPAFALHKDTWIFHDTPKVEVPKDLSFEWDVELMMNKDSKGPDGKVIVKWVETDSLPTPGNGQHTGWEEACNGLTGDDAEVLAAQLEMDGYDKLKAAIDEHERSRGTVPGGIKELFDKMLAPPVIPWKRLLHQFVTRSHATKNQRSLERPRRRWMGMGSTVFPGRKMNRTFHLFFAIDTSGSMSTEDLYDGLGELQGISKIDKDIKIHVVEFDTQVNHEYVLTDGKKVELELHGRGGTDFNQAFIKAKEYAKKGEIDAAIIYTDGFAPGPELTVRPVGIPLLWCLTEGGQHPCEGYGMEIRRPKKSRY